MWIEGKTIIRWSWDPEEKGYFVIIDSFVLIGSLKAVLSLELEREGSRGFYCGDFLCNYAGGDSMAVALHSKQQVEELFQNMEISTKPKPTDAREMPAIDRNNSCTSGSMPSCSEDTNTVDNEGEQGLLVEQGAYYPVDNYYGYYSNGYGTPGVEWNEHGHFVGADSPEFQYAGIHQENVPLVYYTPGYGYPQPTYNPFNPYIPGAVLGMDNQFLSHQPYYTAPMYQHSVSSPGYFPSSLQSAQEVLPAGSPEPGPVVVDTLNANGISVSPSTTIPLPGHSGKIIPTHMPFLRGMLPFGTANSDQNTKVSARASEVQQQSSVSSGQSATQRTTTYTPENPRTMSQGLQLNQQQDANAQGPLQTKAYIPPGKVSSSYNQMKVPVPLVNNSTDFNFSGRGYIGIEKMKQTIQVNRSPINGNSSSDVLSEQNWGPRINRIKNQWISPTGISNTGTEQVVGNNEGYYPASVIDEYNRADFPTSYDHARFFVIKSYSEDDVHKSIKYRVWSSTPNGNKRLDGAYHDAQHRAVGSPGSCPVFLFFSVNASGQFCGVAEMIGPVDFKSTVDFWQLDKWSGCFPVKWHIIKDVSNSNLRHIILENNENKPVTNSRDTQEIKYVQGMEMLKIFKNYSTKTSILDDFEYYEDREKAIRDKKLRLHAKPQPLARFGAQIDSKKSEEHLHQSDGKVETSRDLKMTDHDTPVSCVEESDIKHIVSVSPIERGEERCQIKVVGAKKDDYKGVNANSPVSPIERKEERSEIKVVDAKDNHKGVNSNSSNVLTVGTVAIDTRGINYDSPGVLTVGTIPIDTRINCDAPNVLTIGTMLIDTNGVKFDMPSNLTVGTIAIDPKDIHTAGSVPT